MNHSEKVTYHQKTENYAERHQIRSLFQNLLKELMVKKPEDPFTFLSNYLGDPKKKRVYCIVGKPDSLRSEIISQLAKELNFEVVERELTNLSSELVKGSQE